MKAAIIYASLHHGNTRAVAEAMAAVGDIALIDIMKESKPDISGYELIGIASGIYYNRFHKAILSFINSTEFTENQKVFLVYTCGIDSGGYAKEAISALKKKLCSYSGLFRCRGLDTFGIFSTFGGIAKKHPNETDLKNAQAFIASLI